MNAVVTWETGSEPLGEAVAAIGVFDGVHIGHQALIERASLDARRRSLPCVAVTFDRDPDQVVTPDASAPQLLTLANKCAYLLEAGADRVLVIPFDADLAAMPPDVFIRRVLCAALTPSAVHVGVDFRFGHYAEGSVGTLVKHGEEVGFEVLAHELVVADGAPVTSTRIRALVATGDIALAASLLGRDHVVTGVVVRGRGAGLRDLGVPTANLVPVEHAALPADGVYEGWASVEGLRTPAAISVGVPPSFPQAHERLEVHLVDHDQDLYGLTLTVGFIRRIRPQRRFASEAELATAIKNDIDQVRRHS